MASLQCANLEVPTSSEQSARLRVLGKGRKERLVWVTPRWYGVVQAWLAQRPAAGTDHLFLNQHGRPLSVAGIQYRFKRYCQQAGVHLTCHQLRHTFARRLADERMPTESIAQLLGHVQVETTKRYTAGANPDLREAFLQTMASIEETPSLTPPAELAFPRPRPQPERANSQALERTIGRLADMPEWLQPLLATYLRYRWRNWSAHTAALNARVLSSKLKSPWRWFITHRQLKSLADLQRSDLEAWLEARAAAGISPASRAIDLSQLHACLRFAQEQGLPVSATVFRVDAPIRPAALPRYLTPEAYQQLVTTVYEETASDTPRSVLDRAWFLTLAHTGVRISELLNLRVGDVDFATRRLFIRGSKNGHERVVYLTNALTRTLIHYLTYRSVTADDHLWIVNGKPLSDHQVRYRWHRWREACGVQATPHQLRHTLATQLINNGMPLTSVAKLLGHRSLSSTQHYARLYEHTVKMQFDKAVEQIEGIAAVQWPSSSPESVESLEHIVDSV